MTKIGRGRILANARRARLGRVTLVTMINLGTGAAAAAAVLTIVAGTFGTAQLVNSEPESPAPQAAAKSVAGAPRITARVAERAVVDAPLLPQAAEEPPPAEPEPSEPIEAPEPEPAPPVDPVTPPSEPAPEESEPVGPAPGDPHEETYAAPAPGMCAVNQYGYVHPDAEPCTDSEGVHCPETTGPDPDHPEYLENGELDPEWVKATEGETPDGC